jgi:hypothetical protein
LLSLFVLLTLFHSSLFSQHFEVRDMAGMQWYKGNIHTHAREGESDSSVEYIVKWYKDHGYHFLAITDHSTITLPTDPSASTDSSFLLIPGEEVIGYANASKDELEINALNIQKAILPLRGSTDLGTLQECINAARRQNGVPVINHPNYKWRLGGDILLDSRQCNLFELYNGFPGTNSQGGDGHPGLEEVWDFLLTSGKRIYGVASDDAHSYTQFSPEVSNPGRGWVVVRSKCFDVKEIMRNLDSGLFYSSTGVEIVNLLIEPTRIEIIIKDTGNTEYTTDFIGSAGKLLYSTKNNPAVYYLSSEGTYVRARITDKDGHCAWIQPIFVVR